MRKEQPPLKGLSELSRIRSADSLVAEKPAQPMVTIDVESETVSNPVATLPTSTSDERWLKACIKRGKTEIFMEQRELTEALARLLLANNPDNRRASPSVTKKYAEEMAQGEFDSLNGETIQISQEGMLNNGAGRAEAVLKSGVVLPFLFMFGLRRAARLTVDQGRKRTGADYLDMRGIKGGNRYATAVAQMVYQMHAVGRLTRATDARLSASQVAAYAEKHFAEISEALHFIPRRGAAQVGGVAFLTFLLMILGRKDREAAIQFVTDLVQGSNLQPRTPILILRNRFVSDRSLNRGQKLELAIKAWNAYRAGESVDRLWLNEKIPAVAD